MSQSLDISGILISSLGDRIPCKLFSINDRGYLELYTTDELDVNGRYQLVTSTPRIQTAVKVTACVLSGDSYLVESLPEEAIQEIKTKIIEQKVRGILR